MVLDHLKRAGGVSAKFGADVKFEDLSPFRPMNVAVYGCVSLKLFWEML
jgi:hypothetical protein